MTFTYVEAFDWVNDCEDSLIKLLLDIDALTFLTMKLPRKRKP